MTKRDHRRLIYWDTCVFLAWIKQETCWSPEVTKGIEQTIEQVYAKQTTVMTSALTIAEVLQSQMKPDDKKRYLKVFEHPNLQLMDVDRRVAAKAAVIREFYDTRAFDASGVPIIGSGSVMSLADSIHLATAIHFNVDEFQTVDGSGKHKRRLDLLKLNGDVAGSRLKITLPYYIEPPKPLEGPLDGPKPGPQVGLFDSMGEASATEKTGAEPDEK